MGGVQVMDLVIVLALTQAIFSIFVTVIGAAGMSDANGIFRHSDLKFRQEVFQNGQRLLRGGLIGLVLSPAAIVVLPLAAACGLVWCIWHVLHLAFAPVPVAQETKRVSPEPPKPEPINLSASRRDVIRQLKDRAGIK